MTQARSSVMLRKNTVDRLKSVGSMGDTYDVVINKLLDHYHNYTIKPNPRVKRQT